MSDEFIYVTVRQLAEKLCATDFQFGHEIGFTLDRYEDIVREPSGWFGITMTNMFNGESLVIGYYGGGILYADNTWSDVNETIDDIIQFFRSENVRATASTLICVDKADFEKEN